jgi:penicillin-binding protein 1C
LDAPEAALAAALVRAPNAPPDRVAERACGVLRAQHLPCTGLADQAANAFARKGGMALGEQLAPHLARVLIKPRANDAAAPVQLRSTLDARLQRLAVQTLRSQLAELTRRNVEDGAIVVLDNRSGEVLAWVGSSGSYSDAPAVDGVLARRQPGSTLKPFVYQLAFEQRLLTAASLLHDSPARIRTAGGLYVPENYDRRFRGWVSARDALAGSLNVPAVRAHALLPPDALLQRLNALGLALPQTGGYYGQALALGSAEVSLLGLTNAYRTLANAGLHSPVRLETGHEPPDRQRVASAAASHVVSDILADNAARAPSFGLDSALALPGWAAVKTGTSKDLRDNWCIGYSTRYTVGVWVGNASGAPMHDVSGVSGAAPIWRRVMLALHEGRGWAAPVPPPGLVSRVMEPPDGRTPARTEWFLAGTELAQVQRASHAVQALHAAGAAEGGQGPARSFGITHPRDGSVFALDPDIPPASQRLVFEGATGQWWLNGKPLGQGRQVAWPLWPGRHRLEWESADRSARQSVRFEVRGAVARRPGR